MSELSRRGVKNLHAANNARRVVLALLSCCYAVLWVGGVAQYWLKGGAARQNWLAALFLMLAGLIVLVGTRAGGERLLLLAVALLGFVAEVAGIHLHVPFGTYSYTDALGPRLLGVPPVMALAWMTLAAYVKQMLSRFELAGWIETVSAALWLTAFDLLIDPLAANQLGYWRWADKGSYYGVPLTNFAGWFAISLLAFRILRKKLEPALPVRLTGMSIILFFTLLALGFGSNFVASLGCVLLLLDVLAGYGFIGR